MTWMVYILELSDGSYYTGITNNLNKRIETHTEGKGSKYVRSRLPFRVVYICHEEDRSSASKDELEIKKLSRKDKELLVEGKLSLKKEDIHFFCENCSAVIVVKRNDLESLNINNDKNKFSIRCLVCRSIITHEDEE